jgi:transposase InsO family protein
MKKRFTEAQMVDFLLTRWANRHRTPIFESFNRGLRHECLNEHWFTSLAHAPVVIETWRREYNEERPKKGLGGLTPAAYARQLTATMKTAKVTAGL